MLMPDTAIVNAKVAENAILNMSETECNELLREVGNSLINNIEYILKENDKDKERAKLIGADLSVLDITEEQLRKIAHLYFDLSTKESVIGKMNGDDITCPLGVVATLFERKPKTIPTLTAYILKSQCVLIACGGKELENTNRAFVDVIRSAFKTKKANPDILQGLALTSNSMLLQFITDDLDLVIPIGERDFVDIVAQRTTNYFVKTADPKPYVYIDEAVDVEEVAKEIILSDIKKVLIHKDIYDSVMAHLKGKIGLIANPIEYDFDIENSLHKTTVHAVKNCAEAVEHINKYTNKHTDIIYSKSREKIDYFCRNTKCMNSLANSLEYHDSVTDVVTVVSNGYLSGNFTYDKLISYKKIKDQKGENETSE